MQQTLRARRGIAKGLNGSQKPAKFDSNLPAHSCNDRKQNASAVRSFFLSPSFFPSISLSLFYSCEHRVATFRWPNSPVAYRYAPFQINSHCLPREFLMRTRPVYVGFFTLLSTCLRLWLQWMTNRHSDETFKLKQSNMYIDSYDYRYAHPKSLNVSFVKTTIRSRIYYVTLMAIHRWKTTTNFIDYTSTNWELEKNIVINVTLSNLLL